MELLKVKQAAEILGVNQASVYDLVQSGKLPHYRIGMGRGVIRLRQDDVEAYLESCYRETRSPDVAETPKTRRRRNLPSLRGLSQLAHCVPSLPRSSSARPSA